MALQSPSAAKGMLMKSVAAPDGRVLAEVLIKSSDRQGTELAVTEAGGSVRAHVGDIMTARLPLAAVEGIAARPEVLSVEASKRLRLLMDTARSSDNTNVAVVQEAGYDGADVVVGLIDSGLDYSRSDFRDPDGRTRVQYLRFQSVSSDGTMTVTQCANDYIEDGACPIAANNDAAIGHGTHVTGIAAGNDAVYKGVAPAADIMMVRNDFNDDINEGGPTSGTFSGGVIDGVVEIFKKSDILDKAAVVNISQGTHIGAHDDTSLLEQSLNSAVAGEYAEGGKDYGRAIVAAAGNEHTVAAALANAGLGAFDGGIHANVNVPNGGSHGWRLWIVDAAGLAVPYLAVDAWFGAGQGFNCKVAANAYRYSDVFGASFGIPPLPPKTDAARIAIQDTPLSSDMEETAGDAVAEMAMATDSSDPNNSRPRALILYGPADGAEWDDLSVTGAGNSSYFLDVIVRAAGGTCTGDIWIEGGGTYVNFMGGITGGGYDVASGTNGAAYSSRDGNNDSTVCIPGTASGVITAGAYLQTKPGAGCPSSSCWTDRTGAQHDATDIGAPDAEAAQISGGTVQERSPFSSIGPPAYSYSGRKPDILAPGDPIISVLPTGLSLNDALLVATPHYKSQGTSQASPHAAGVVALILQRNNTLTAADLKKALTETATKAASHNNRDGFGNIKAAAAIAYVPADASGYSGRGNLNQGDLDDGGGGGGCFHTIAPAAASHSLPQLLPVLAALAIIATRRRRGQVLTLDSFEVRER
ncbi:MAG: S8 family serine peptidase [Proteobacteria bacterium]|nr:S8 family serine peptidase [Pseudomonadota bacterium]